MRSETFDADREVERMVEEHGAGPEVIAAIQAVADDGWLHGLVKPSDRLLVAVTKFIAHNEGILARARNGSGTWIGDYFRWTTHRNLRVRSDGKHFRGDIYEVFREGPSLHDTGLVELRT